MHTCGASFAGLGWRRRRAAAGPARGRRGGAATRRAWRQDFSLDTSGSWTSPGGRYDAKAHRPDIRATAQHFLAELTRNKLKIPVKELGTLRQYFCVPLESEGFARVYALRIPAQSVNQAFFQVAPLDPPCPAPSSSPFPSPTRDRPTSLGMVACVWRSAAELRPPAPPPPPRAPGHHDLHPARQPGRFAGGLGGSPRPQAPDVADA